MDTPGIWRKSSYSDGGEGNACVEVADRHTRIVSPPQESSEKGDSMPPQRKL